MKSPQKETKYIHASAADLLHALLEQEIPNGANADIAKTKQNKQIAFVLKWWMQYLLLKLKSENVNEASHHQIFMGGFPTISYAYQF